MKLLPKTIEKKTMVEDLGNPDRAKAFILGAKDITKEEIDAYRRITALREGINLPGKVAVKKAKNRF